MIPVLGVIFNHLKIPIYWPIFLTLAIITTGLTITLRKNILLEDFKELKKSILSLKIKKTQIYTFFVLILFAITAYMYIQGAFNYPWFENGDPYVYALTTKYITLEKTYEVPYYYAHFAYPYTQGYQIFMAVLHQTNNSIYWTLKFFNALIVSFSILFFYYFTKKLMQNTSSAFWATFTLTAIPAWVSHFVFSLNFNMSLMFLLFYAIFSIKENKNWKYLAAIFYGSIIINHFYTSVIITVLIAIVYLLRVLVYKEFNKNHLDAILLGLGIGLIFWIPGLTKHWNVLKNGAQLGGLNSFLPIIQKINTSLSLKIALVIMLIAITILYIKQKKWFKRIKKILNKKNIPILLYLIPLIILLLILIIPSQKIMYAKGSATRIYTLKDFFIAQKGNMINNPIGIGLVLMTIFIIGLIILIINFKKLFKEKNYNLLVILTWTIFTYIGIKGAQLSIGFAPFRMWTFFGMAMSIITGYTIHLIFKSINNTFKNKLAKTSINLILIILLITGAYITSFTQKYWHNTAPWPEHQIMVPDSQKLYIWMREGIPKNSMVLPLCNSPEVVLGYDMLTKPWKNEQLNDGELKEKNLTQFYKESLKQTLQENYKFLKENNYEYTILGADCIAKMKANITQVENKIKEMLDSPKFTLVKNTKTEFLFKVN